MDSVTTSHLKQQAKMSNRGAYDEASVSVYDWLPLFDPKH